MIRCQYVSIAALAERISAVTHSVVMHKQLTGDLTRCHKRSLIARTKANLRRYYE